MAEGNHEGKGNEKEGNIDDVTWFILKWHDMFWNNVP